MDKDSVAIMTKNGGVRKIKEWQAIMDYICALPVKTKGAQPMIPVDQRASDVGAIKAG
jgi:hypothetical protein